jgi:D-alanyl-D-alanine carboxypeptidase (penicillin-binding protein 5/6)
MLKRGFAVILALCLLVYPMGARAIDVIVEDGEGEAEETLAFLQLEEDVPAAPVIAAMADSLPAKSAILLEQATGNVLFEQNPDEPLPPASVTKVMTLLLVMEALESGKIMLDDMVACSEYAASMGGSQIWLKVGEKMSVDDLLKAVCIASANDASVLLGEHVSGSNDAFVARMNERAAELSMSNTTFKNATGLDEEGHLTTARDIAIMSRELMNHPRIAEYSTVWMDELRGGATELVNTNKLVRFYNGSTGLKTGTTNGAGSCLSATATREGLSLVAVVMGSPTSDDRFAAARGLLDYGFANYRAIEPPPIRGQLAPLPVLRGVEPYVDVTYDPPGVFVIEKGTEDAMTQEITLPENVEAPVEAGQVLGQAEVLLSGEAIGSYPLKAAANVERLTLGKAFERLLRAAV